MAKVEVRVYEGRKQVARYEFESTDREGVQTTVNRAKENKRTSVIWVGNRMVYKKK